MTESTSYAAHRLCDEWSMILASEGYQARTFPPLLTILEQLVGSSNNSRGGGGLAHTRNLVDTKALTLLMHIQDVAGAWLFEWDVKAHGLIGQVRAFADTLETRWRTSQIPESNYLHLSGSLERFATQIWELYEPPKRVPLRESPCPSCQRAKYTTEAGDAVDNLVATFGDAGEPRVDCQWVDCGMVWSGIESLRALGVRLGSTVDEDVLREMGVGA